MRMFNTVKYQAPSIADNRLSSVVVILNDASIVFAKKYLKKRFSSKIDIGKSHIDLLQQILHVLDVFLFEYDD